MAPAGEPQGGSRRRTIVGAALLVAYAAVVARVFFGQSVLWPHERSYAYLVFFLLCPGIVFAARAVGMSHSCGSAHPADSHSMGKWRGRIARSARGALPLLVVLVLSAAPAAPGMAQDKDGYVGEARCATCHKAEQENWAHTVHARVFRLNPRNALAARGCEACHGPGAKHLENAADKAAIIAYTRRRGAPVDIQNAQCLQCHKGRSRIYWQGSVHETSRLACSDCHNPMAKFSASGLLAKGTVSETCFTCHQQQRAEFRKRSHMPVLEGRMSCGDCHNPHGSITRPLLKADSVNQLCYGCHAEKRGPFIWEHAPVRRNCLECHLPHGSSHESLLVVARPFLCQQCHANVSHPANLITRSNLPRGVIPDERAVSRSCSNCHSQIHGSNHPSGARFHR